MEILNTIGDIATMIMKGIGYVFIIYFCIMLIAQMVQDIKALKDE